MEKILVLSVVLFFVGCVPTTEDIRILNNDVDLLMNKIDGYQEEFAGEVDEIQEKVKVVNDAMKEQDGLIESIGAGIEASKPFNPYADEMNAVFALFAVLAGKKIHGDTKAKRKLNNENAGLRNGIARFGGEHEPSIASVLHDTVKSEILKANGKT